MSRPYWERLAKTIRLHQNWRLKECLNLIPAENRGSQEMLSMFMTDLGNRYSAPDQFYRGTKYLDELTALTEEAARKVFRAKYADVRPLSGHTADMAVLLSMASPGDKLLSVSPDNGGYPGISHLGLGKLLGLKNLYFPFDEEAVNLDADGSSALIRESEPDLVFFGSSFFPFPHPVRKLSNAAGTCVFDGSHVLGLLAGGEFQDPLREGCSLLIGSTHKSLPGPQGGIILSNDEEAFSLVSGKIHPGIVDNFHLNRVAALAVALLEMLEFGRAYAQQVIKNSQALAVALASEGVRLRGVAHGYTKSHQVLLDYDTSQLKTLARKLERANIIVNDGGRIGTSELARMGYTRAQMEPIAELIAAVILGEKPAEFVAKDVKTLVRDFQQPKYVLRSFPRLLEWLPDRNA